MHACVCLTRSRCVCNILVRLWCVVCLTQPNENSCFLFFSFFSLSSRIHSFFVVFLVLFLLLHPWAGCSLTQLNSWPSVAAAVMFHVFLAFNSLFLIETIYSYTVRQSGINNTRHLCLIESRPTEGVWASVRFVYNRNNVRFEGIR